MPQLTQESLNILLKGMLDEWFEGWCAYHQLNSADAGENEREDKFTYFSQRGDTRDVWSSIAEFDDRLTAWLGSRRSVVWRIRPRWTPHFLIECELRANWDEGRTHE